MTDKDPAEKVLFAFTDGAVLAEELGGGAGQLRNAESPSSVSKGGSVQIKYHLGKLQFFKR
jgi:hypothetical protein